MLRIMPRQKVYFDCFDRCATAAVEAASKLREMLSAPEDYTRFVGAIETLEQSGDEAAALVRETLDKNLATPMDPALIRSLMEALDDILDGIDTVAHKLVMYRAHKPRAEAKELAALLVPLAEATRTAVANLHQSRNADSVLAACREVHRLEAEADKVLRRGIGALFDELKDPFELIKWKEILELLEHATDKCEDAIKIIEDVLRRHG